VSCFLAAVTLASQPAVLPPRARAQQNRAARDIEEALARLRLHPRDAYLQYAALQLARRAGRFEYAAEEVARISGAEDAGRRTGTRRADADLLGLFTGARAVQESLQLDAMRVATGGTGRPAPTTMTGWPAGATVLNANVATPPRSRQARRRAAGANRRPTPVVAPTPPPMQVFDSMGRPVDPSRLAPRFPAGETVAVSRLTGPTIKSHPWETMLKGRKPEVSALSRSVPEDFYLVEFRALSKLLETLDASDLWGAHLYSQAYREAASLDASDRLKRQLALRTEPLLRPFYDLAVEEVAAAGSDPFVREGSDITLLFRLRQTALFHARVDSFLAEAEREHAGARRETGQYLGVEYVHLYSPERDLSVVAADPEPGLHVRSNSLAAFRRVVEAVKGRRENGEPVRRLGETAEFQYVRTLLPRGDSREDGFFYMSDAFVRRLVGPQLKLTERRRLLCYNHLRMMGHAALLFRTEQGRWPASLEELQRMGASPGLFGAAPLECPEHGQYKLSSDGTTGFCTRHGHALRLTPNIEIPAASVSAEEANLYADFLDEYNGLWRTFFDPIAIRLRVSPEQFRAETIILPLIDNSAYTGLAAALGGGEGEPLDAARVAPRDIFTMALRFNKSLYLRELSRARPGSGSDFLREIGVPADIATKLNTNEFLSKGIDSRVGLHIYDARPAFDLNTSEMLGEVAAMGAGRAGSFGLDEMLIGMAVFSLNSPVYISVPVRDERVVDRYLEGLDAALALYARQGKRSRFFEFEQDFYRYTLPQGQAVRSFGLKFGPLKLRFFYTRIGDQLYVASKPFILEDLAALHASPAPARGPDEDATGHALARVRPENWREVLPDYRLAWAENEREACLNNLGPLTDVARALASSRDASAPAGEALDRALLETAGRLHAVRYYCPEGGAYHFSPEGREVACSVHGTAAKPRQPPAPSEQSAAARAMSSFKGLTASLTFMEDGLHATLVIDRK
jgi:hypothetical protein